MYDIKCYAIKKFYLFGKMYQNTLFLNHLTDLYTIFVSGEYVVVSRFVTYICWISAEYILRLSRTTITRRREICHSVVFQDIYISINHDINQFLIYLFHHQRYFLKSIFPWFSCNITCLQIYRKSVAIVVVVVTTEAVIV